MPCYAVRDSKVVSEIIDGEAIIMNLQSGIYFSTAGPGAVIWEGITGGFDEGQIKQRLAQLFTVTPDVLDIDFGKFIQEVIENGLAEIDADTVRPSADWSGVLPATRWDYAAPLLNQYGDLEDLALLDPIHDVAEAEGWPAPKPAEGWPAPKPAEGWPAPKPHG